MPRTKSLPYEWYNSPNIHLTTLHDFRRLCRERGLRIVRETDLVQGDGRCRKVSLLPNFFADYGIFMLERE